MLLLSKVIFLVLAFWIRVFSRFMNNLLQMLVNQLSSQVTPDQSLKFD